MMNDVIRIIGVAALAVILLLGGGLGGCAAINSVRVWSAETSGRAALAELEAAARNLLTQSDPWRPGRGTAAELQARADLVALLPTPPKGNGS